MYSEGIQNLNVEFSSEMAPSSVTTRVALGTGTFIFTILGAIIYKKLRKEKIPKEWELVGNVKELCIYPLKSGKANGAECLFLTNKGVQEVDKTDKSIELRDRSFMIYNSTNGEIRTARQLPRSVLVEIKAAENGVIFSAPDKIDLYISIPKIMNNVKITFGQEVFLGTDCGDGVAKWLSDFLLGKGDGLRLAYGDGSQERNLLRDHKKWATYYKNIDNDLAGIFSDLAAVHMVNTATVDDLNRKLVEEQKDAVTFLNFRPNILVEGPGAFAEDKWQYVKIGSQVVAKVCLECLRCIESSVCPNGVMNKAREPTKTLELYRKSNGPFKCGVMGIYLKVLQTGRIRKGDAVYVSKVSA